MTLDDVRTMIVEQARDLEEKPWRSTGIGKWCTKHGLGRGHVSEFLNGRRLPTTAILDALGLEWRVMPKALATPADEERLTSGGEG